MARYNVNNIIDNRYVLTESLSYDALSGRQVWAAKDNQTGKRLIGRFESNGRVEWFDDNRPESKVPISKPLQTFSAPPKREHFVNKRSRLRSFYPVFVLLGILLIALGYYRKDQWLERIKEDTSQWNNQQTPYEDSKRLEGLSDTKSVYTPPVATEKEEVSQLESAQNEIYQPEKKTTVNSMNWSNAAVELNSVDRLNVEDRRLLFLRAGDAFTNLRTSNSNRKIIDSLYIVYMAKGSRSFLEFQQHGSENDRLYAIAWYQLAYRLKASVELREKLSSTENAPSRRNSARPRTPKKMEEKRPIFTKDPELK